MVLRPDTDLERWVCQYGEHANERSEIRVRVGVPRERIDPFETTVVGEHEDCQLLFYMARAVLVDVIVPMVLGHVPIGARLLHK